MLADYLLNKHKPPIAAKAVEQPNLSPVEKAKYDEAYARVLADTGDEVKARLAAMGVLRRLRRGLAVKAESVGDETLVSGWGVLFADAYVKDLHGEYFPRDGEFFLDFYRNAPLWVEHGFDPRYRWQPVGQRVNHEVHEHGIWITHRLFAEHPYYAKTLELVKTGRTAYSSDSVLHLSMQNEQPDGGLKVWPLVGLSLVLDPAEPGLGNVIIEGEEDSAP